MKKLIFALIVMLPILGKAQAHLGSTLADIKAMYPDKVFKVDYTTSGQKYASAEMYYGTFVYYFDKETGLSNYCIQHPDNMTALNAQVEVYNKKYVIISETSWKAYLEGGGILKIKLVYDEEYKLYVFQYTN
jgi:hypothetical protein